VIYPKQLNQNIPPAIDYDDPVLRYDSVSICFTNGKLTIKALDNVTFELKKGTITGLIGPDAAGKTTLLRISCGLLKPGHGKVTVMGMDATLQSQEVQSIVGYMPQKFGLYEELTVQENLELYADLQGIVGKAREIRFNELLKLAGLSNFTRRLAKNLSGGMKQKLGLACVLIKMPVLLLLDEPTVGIDPVSRRELWQIITGLVKSNGSTALISTAYLDEAEKCDEVVLLHNGKVLATGSPSQLKEKLHGRTYFAAPLGHPNKGLRKLLCSHPVIQDAIVFGNNVRFLAKHSLNESEQQSIETQFQCKISSTTPRLEDFFVTQIQPECNNPKGLSFNSSAKILTSKKHESLTAGPVIEVSNVSRKFNNFYAVKGITFSVHYGEIFGLLGANGAGKSTTFRMLCGLLPPTSGKLKVAGVDLLHAAAKARERVGYVSQKFSLYSNLSVLENLRFYSSAYGLIGNNQKEKIDWALKQFDLLPFKDSVSGTLPLGYKQRLSMACALMHEPDVLFLDEPTSGVDPLARREFWSWINELSQTGVTIMVTTHFLEEAEYCDRIAIMAEGEILAIGSPSQIKKEYCSARANIPTVEDAFIELIKKHSS